MSGSSKHMNILMISRGENYLGSIIFQRAEGGFVYDNARIFVSLQTHKLTGVLEIGKPFYLCAPQLRREHTCTSSTTPQRTLSWTMHQLAENIESGRSQSGRFLGRSLLPQFLLISCHFCHFSKSPNSLFLVFESCFHNPQIPSFLWFLKRWTRDLFSRPEECR